MIKKFFKATLISLFASSSVFAAPVVLTFEGVGDFAHVENFYNGGTDSAGNSGTNYGIEFGANSLGIIEGKQGGSGNFENEPSSKTVLFFLTGSAVLNNAAGFDTGFSFFYSSSTAASVKVYDGLNATGNLLTTISLVKQMSDNCKAGSTTTYCNFSSAGGSFSGIAKSIDFGGAQNQIGFDNITFGSEQAVVNTSTVPEPASLSLLALGMLGFVAARRKSAK